MKISKIVLTLFIATVFISCNCQQKQENQTTTIEIISVAQLEKAADSIQLVDVRTPEEYAEGHIKHAKNINVFDDNFIALMSELDKEKPVYVYCRKGGRSAKASAKLQEAGFTKIYDLDGGFSEWKSEGKAISKNE